MAMLPLGRWYLKMIDLVSQIASWRCLIQNYHVFWLMASIPSVMTMLGMMSVMI